MKILVIGDFHGKFPTKLKAEAKKADLILSTGDFGGSDKLLKMIFKHFAKRWWKVLGPEKAKKYVMEDYNSGKKVLEELNSLGKKVFTIPGNWDFVTHSKLERTGGFRLKLFPELVKELKNIKWWNRGIKKVDGLKILAFGGSVTAGAYLEKDGFFGNKPVKLRKHERKNRRETEQVMRHGAKDIDILLAHYTPYGYFDKVKFPGENPMNGKHVGFKGYTEYIKKYQPRLFLSGHMHEYQGVKKLGKTLIVATGAAKEGKAVLIDWPENKKQKIKVKLIK